MDKQEDRIVVVEMVFGSHLYGTDTPESDRDYKGVVLPTREEVLLGKIPNTLSSSTGDNDMKNVKGDVDRDWYSLHYFIKLACAGETCVLDMLHAPENMLIQTSPIWGYIIMNRHLFYTKSLKALVGYARRQAAKYGIKGSRVGAMEKAIAGLNEFGDQELRLCDIWDTLPVGEHLHKFDEDPWRMYQVTGRKFVERMKVEEVLGIVQSNYDKYGARARDAAENKNVDWKALSHAIRAAMEIIEILEDGTITFPLKEAEYLKDVKLGKLDYATVVAPHLESLLERCEQAATASGLQEKVDRSFWDHVIIMTLCRYVFGMGDIEIE